MFGQLRSFQTSTTQRDIDQAAKYIGAGAATVGVAGSGTASLFCFKKKQFPCHVGSHTPSSEDFIPFLEKVCQELTMAEDDPYARHFFTIASAF